MVELIQRVYWVPEISGSVVNISSLRAFVFVASFAIPEICQRSEVPVVAYVNGTALSLAFASGTITQRIELKHPVYDFALSGDRKLFVTVALDTVNGGALYLLDLRTHKQTRLTNSPFYMKNLDQGETEVYSDCPGSGFSD